MPPTSLLLAAILAAGAAPDPHRAEIEAWRAQRVERLKVPDGWLSLVGLDWIEPGRTVIGSAVDASRVGPDADAFVKIAGMPPTLGTLTLAEGKLSIVLDEDAGATVDGKATSAGDAAVRCRRHAERGRARQRQLHRDRAFWPACLARARFGRRHAHRLRRHGLLRHRSRRGAWKAGSCRIPRARRSRSRT